MMVSTLVFILLGSNIHTKTNIIPAEHDEQEREEKAATMIDRPDPTRPMATEKIKRVLVAFAAF